MAASPAWFDARRQDGWAVERRHFAEVGDVGWDGCSRPELVRPGGSYYDDNGDGGPFHRRLVRDYAHPNHVTVIAGRLAVTMLAAREVRCLRTFATLASFEGYPHDAVDFDGLVWTTSTDGTVRAWDAGDTAAWRLVESYDTSKTGHVGWCRGVLVSDHGIAVALTQMHGRSQYEWRDGAVERTETSVLWLERGSGKLLGRVDLGDARRSKVSAVMTTCGPDDLA